MNEEITFSCSATRFKSKRNIFQLDDIEGAFLNVCELI